MREAADAGRSRQASHPLIRVSIHRTAEFGNTVGQDGAESQPVGLSEAVQVQEVVLVTADGLTQGETMLTLISCMQSRRGTVNEGR